jgi:hypothetical protein
MEEGVFAKTLGRLGIGSTLLLDNDMKVLVNINPKLSVRLAAIKLAAGFLE